MKTIQQLFSVGYMLVVALFFVCGGALIVLATIEIWSALDPARSESWYRWRSNA